MLVSLYSFCVLLQLPPVKFPYIRKSVFLHLIISQLLQVRKTMALHLRTLLLEILEVIVAIRAYDHVPAHEAREVVVLVPEQLGHDHRDSGLVRAVAPPHLPGGKGAIHQNIFRNITISELFKQNTLGTMRLKVNVSRTNPLNQAEGSGVSTEQSNGPDSQRLFRHLNRFVAVNLECRVFHVLYHDQCYTEQINVKNKLMYSDFAYKPDLVTTYMP